MPTRKTTLFLVFVLLLLVAFAILFFIAPAVQIALATPTPRSTLAAPTPPLVPTEHAVVTIPLIARVSINTAEYSGMAWYGDNLILLPQYPNRFGIGDGALLSIPKADLLAFLDGKTTSPLIPRYVPLSAPGLTQRVPGFEGFESIGFIGDDVFMTIEAKPGTMMGNLVKGKIASDLSRIQLDATTLLQIPPQAAISNFSDEAMVVAGNKLLTMYEANGAGANPQPVAHVFDFKPAAVGTLAFPNIEYRITDATPTDAANRFWAINYFFPGDVKILPLFDPLAQKFGKGLTHAQYPQVERLVEFQYSDAGITLTNTPPLQFVLPNADARNWEGIARLDNRGFLIVTDSFPQTILGFAGK